MIPALANDPGYLPMIPALALDTKLTIIKMYDMNNVSKDHFLSLRILLGFSPFSAEPPPPPPKDKSYPGEINDISLLLYYQNFATNVHLLYTSVNFY